MAITISRPVNGISINGDEYLLDESGEPIEFETINEMLRFFAEHNFTITDLLDLNFHFEEGGEPEANACLLAANECEETIAARRRWGW